MPQDGLQLLGPYPAWHGGAHRGRWRAPDGGVRPVTVLVGPETSAADAEERARAAARTAMQLVDPGVLRLLDVGASGERVAWIYEEASGLGLGHTIAGPGSTLLPTRVAAELVAQVAETLHRLGAAGRAHPGPEPADLLVDHDGRVRLAGFAGPFAQSPDMRDPAGSPGDPAVVWRLGVLLAHLTGGSSPGSATTRESHAPLVRRALIRCMSRPGPVVTERFANWLRGMLSWEPGERPPLSVVGAGLRKAARELGDEGLEAWCARHVDTLRLQAEREPNRTPVPVMRSERFGRGDPASEPTLDTPADQSTLPGVLRTVPRDDDPTQEASGLHGGAGRVGFGMPVRVGPPPEAVRPTPSLPPGFLEAEDDDTFDVAAEQALPRWLLPVTAGLATVVLLGAAALLAAYLLQGVGGNEPPADASLSDVISTAPINPTLIVKNPHGWTLTATCGSASLTGDADLVLPAAGTTCQVQRSGDGGFDEVIPIEGRTVVSCRAERTPHCQAP